MIPKKIIHQYLAHPKRLFVIDGFGALLSAFLLGVVLVRYESIFGIPPSALYILAVLPLFFLLFDLYSYQQESKLLPQQLQIIAYINISYCVLSLGFAWYHSHSVTVFGWGYIIIEILIVLFLAAIQYQVGRQLLDTYQG